MKKILFLIHDLGVGGAEKVLVNLVNNMDHTQFDITVMSIFNVGVNRQFLSDKVKYISCYNKMPPGNSKIMKLWTPQQLHKKLIHDVYDIEVAYLEGPCTRIVSGCTNPNTKLIAWVHREVDINYLKASYRNVDETQQSYNRMNQIVCVSEKVKQAVRGSLRVNVPISVYYNTNESEKIIELSHEAAEEISDEPEVIKLVGVGKLLKIKGFDRLIRIVERLLDKDYNVKLYILGVGPEDKNLKEYVIKHNLEENVIFLGYQINPYKYLAKCDLFVCASHAEGFSTAATEALIVGTPVCTVDVAGMKEMLGKNNEFGIVTQNDEYILERAIEDLIINKDKLEIYKKRAVNRGKYFSSANTVTAVEKMFEEYTQDRE